MRNRIAVALLLLLAMGLMGWAIYRDRQVSRGAAAFHRYGCAHCHGSTGAPNLTNVTAKYDPATIRQFIQDPESVYRARGRKPLNDGYMAMPRLNVSSSDASDIVAYLKHQAD